LIGSISSEIPKRSEDHYYENEFQEIRKESTGRPTPAPIGELSEFG
jgi:hypothetical protein